MDRRVCPGYHGAVDPVTDPAFVPARNDLGQEKWICTLGSVHTPARRNRNLCTTASRNDSSSTTVSTSPIVSTVRQTICFCSL